LHNTSRKLKEKWTTNAATLHGAHEFQGRGTTSTIARVVQSTRAALSTENQNSKIPLQFPRMLNILVVIPQCTCAETLHIYFKVWDWTWGRRQPRFARCTDRRGSEINIG